MLTSQEIIQEYQEMCKRTRRTKVNLPEKLALILEEPGLFTEESPQTAEESGENTGSSPIKKERKKEKKEKESVDFSAFPEELNYPEFQEAWLSWVKFRKEIKHTLTDSTIKAQIKKLLKEPDPVAVINQSIEKGWQGLFPVKEDSNGKVNRTVSTGASGSNGKSGTGGFKYFNPETQEYES